MLNSYSNTWGGGVAALGAFVTALAFSQLALAQSTPNLLEIRIGPPGCAVELEGPQRTITSSPNAITRPVAGWYRLKASHRGFESFQQDVYIDSQTPVSISGALNPKSRWKAGVRSIIPGYGHYYSGRTAHGVVFSALTAGMLVGFYFFDAEADRDLETYEDLRAEYDAAESVEEQETLLPAVEAALEEAYDADSNRLTWGYLTLGVYVYQIVDAVLFFPSTPEVRLGEVQLGLAMPNAHTVGLGATYAF